MQNTSRVTVVDSIMGAGKTTWATQRMNEDSAPWLYVAPLRSEANRIITKCPDRQFIQPLDDPESENGWAKTKSADLLRLIKNGENIATTHALFKLMQEDTVKALKDGGYKLILDEVVEMVEPLRVSNQIHEMLFSKGALLHDPESTEADKVRKVLPGPDSAYDQLFMANGNGILTVQKVRQWAATNRLVEVDGRLLVWLLPVDCFRAFQEVFNLTYLFDGSLAKPYFQIQGVSCDYRSVIGNRTHGYRLTDYDPQADASKRADIWSRINLYEGNLNVPGNPHQALSKNKWEKNKEGIRETMAPKLATFFLKHGMPDTGASDNLWTVYKAAANSLVGNNVAAKSWLACNARATNDYRTKANLAYLCNIFQNTSVDLYFKALNFHLEEEKFALSQLIQWVWRSRIRMDEPISLYLPSSRMRSILKQWANGGGLDLQSTVSPLNA